MNSYLDIVKKILKNGEWKENRTGVKTLVVPNIAFSHDMSTGFPLLTTKKMAIKSLLVELEGFIKGITSKKWYQERGCKIWDEWANPKAVDEYIHQKALKISNEHNLSGVYVSYESAKDLLTWQGTKDTQKQVDDLGAFYPHQWRRFGEAIDEDDNGVVNGVDQLQKLIHTLKTNPNDRRMVVSAWNPNQLDRAALPACHVMWIVTHLNGKLNLHWTQRSCDTMLGIPFNIASYATLLLLLCREVGMTPGNLSAAFCDCHIYENHVEGAREQLEREPKPLPDMKILPKDGDFDIFKWTHKDVELTGYNYCPPIKFDVAV